MRLYPVSFPQEQAWFLHRFSPDDTAHQALVTVRVRGPLDLDRVDRAVTALHRRHEILRSTYVESDGRPWQTVHPPEPIPVKRLDIGDVRDEQQRMLAGIVSRELHEPFDLTRLPLIRWTVVRLSDEEYDIIIVQNHLLYDGWSSALLMREFEALYNAVTEQAGPPVRYRDFARAQREALPGALLARVRGRLGELPPRLELQTDHPRPGTPRFRGETLRADLPDVLTAALRAHGTPLFSTMLAAFYTFLYRCTGQRDICVGSSFAGRPAGTEDLIGPLVNTVLLRHEVDATLGFAELTGAVDRMVRDARQDELLPFAELVRALNPAREPGRNPLTDVLFSMDDAPIPPLRLGGAAGTVVEHGNGAARTDLNVVVLARDERTITMLWEYDADLFDGATMGRMADGYLRLLTDALARPGAPLFALDVLGDEERVRLLEEWNPERHRPGFPPVHRAVREQARNTPDAPAIRDGDRTVSYAELVAAADALAAVLRAHGVLPRTVVGMCLPRGADLVIAELAVLCAGAAYLPLDPDNPPARLAGQFDAAGAVLIVTDSARRHRLPDHVARLLMDRLPREERTPQEHRIHQGGTDSGGAPQAGSAPDTAAPEDLAYLIATSGSTGAPKIVMVEHRSLANVVAWRRRRCDLGPADHVAQIASPGFDPSVTDIWPTLTAGAVLHVPDQDTKLDPERLRSWMADAGITVTELPTALAERVLALPWPAAAALRTLIIGGDRLRVRPPAGLPFRVLNEYGPTEAAATTTAGQIEPAAHIEPAWASAGPPDIGRPIDGVSVYILDAWRQLVPPGAPGELWIGGAGVARGYHGAPGLTADRFVPDPFSGVPGSRMYRTGDLARHLPSGLIDFIGRRDRQIKLRGYRIEPVEIVEALRAHPAVADAVVLARTGPDGGEKRLVAYLEAADRPGLRQQIREHLADRVPRYMIPSDVVVLDSLPINRNGKVDERALPPLGPAEPAPGFRAPRTETERWLAEAWCAVLRLDRVGLDDNFFEIGGHSLLLFEVQRAVAARGHDVSIVTFFEYATIEHLAAHLDGGGPGRTVLRGAGRTRLAARRETLRAANRNAS
ncbi:amino acid adenylation domain-containing protein [Catenuloplanes nepalensis]|uniref:Amino acid adenylation domain-containing protein n=1 Tax=Catenuloplanes nepalensis TaxID=587533 RepID=A0ABT9MRZ3_9ACTN|nr:amino acid adenylation domain-containing protein [Catenuloplanes nepalensis]MDP9794202.1 amino acid adenylation domain-containing protein [Catenuloplanes nepalensis]